jgi:hypothetical protein
MLRRPPEQAGAQQVQEVEAALGLEPVVPNQLDELAAKRVYEFAFIITPLNLGGATNSTVAPIAIRLLVQKSF